MYTQSMIRGPPGGETFGVWGWFKCDEQLENMFAIKQ